MKNKHGYTLIEMFTVTALIILIAGLTIINIMRTKGAANSAQAKTVLKNSASSLETYYNSNGRYPNTMTELVTAVPTYINFDYFNGIYAGYSFNAALSSQTYNLVASPVTTQNGEKSFSITTGSVLSEL